MPAQEFPHDKFDDLLAANAEYQKTFKYSDLTGQAKKGLAIVTCMDSRIDPLSVVGMRSGDAKPLRSKLIDIYGSDEVVKNLDDASLVEMGENLRRGVPIATPVFDGAHETEIKTRKKKDWYRFDPALAARAHATVHEALAAWVKGHRVHDCKVVGFDRAAKEAGSDVASGSLLLQSMLEAKESE